MTLAVVTASTNITRARPCLDSWRQRADDAGLPILIIENGTGDEPYLGTVPAFRKGVDQILAESDAEIICAFHDDFEIREDGWDTKVLRYFGRYPAMGLAGFGGAVGLGAQDIYQVPYDPMQLARVGFRSDLLDAEAHGMRSLLAEQVACLDGFSQIGRRAFWLGETRGVEGHEQCVRPWTVLESLGFIHHAYDGALGCLARRYGWETWYLPLRAKHWGGQTAVGDAGYAAWAETNHGGDRHLWEEAHRIWYENFRDVLPLRT